MLALRQLMMDSIFELISETVETGDNSRPFRKVILPTILLRRRPTLEGCHSWGHTMVCLEKSVKKLHRETNQHIPLLSSLALWGHLL